MGIKKPPPAEGRRKRPGAEDGGRIRREKIAPGHAAACKVPISCTEPSVPRNSTGAETEPTLLV